MMNTAYIIVFWVLILFPILYVIKIKNWNIKVAIVLVGRILLSIVFFLNGMYLGLQRNWVQPPYEKEWDFFIKSLQNGKTEVLLELLLLIIIVIFDLLIIFCYRNKKK
ncbi:TPA: hypothetical protein QCO65_003384 [Bacillus cereus]|uniref:Uncharacterized protein n=1 Tax=Bacillus cereus TaxID=1396 RepID=A0A1S9UL99_BACCE|nr:MULTISPECIES: hypothetical protein [Bacillus cereus group]OOR23007.1 hypothetical protein BW892_17175 [Bacillus cereus]QWG28775.1 hypothetical protein EXW58_14855 [Bacillus mycoides]HDR3888957.1 hypothetical protein [Bacillus cereus]